MESGNTVDRDDAIDGALVFPMTSAQLGIWFTEQLVGGSAANNLSFALRLSGDMDLTALRLSRLIVMLRHETLRTTFDLVDGRPAQIVRQELPDVLTYRDVSQTSNPEVAAYAAVREFVHAPFDLTRGPLLRSLLVDLGPRQHILCCAMHHIIADGWSLGIFMRELASSYTAVGDRGQPALPPLPLRYTDCVLWEQQWLSSEEFRIQLASCIRPLAGSPPQPSLAPAGSRETGSLAGASRAVRLAPDLLARMTSVARRLGTTQFALSLATFQILLWQITSHEDVVVGIPVARRNRAETENIIGLFANLSAARAILSGDPAFAEVLGQARDATLHALAHADVPFQHVVRALRPTRTIASNPIFRTLFVAAPPVAPIESFGAMRAAPYVVAAGGALHELAFSVIEDGSGGAWIRAEYRTELFADAMIAELLDHYVVLLTEVSLQPHRRISSLAALPGPWIALRPAPREQARGSATPPEPVRTEPSDPALEAALARAWGTALGGRLPKHDENFFDLGGDSLHAIEIAREIGNFLKRPVPVTFVFREPTIRGMARLLGAEGRVPSGILPIKREGARPPLFVGSDSSALRSLGRALTTEQPFYLLNIFALQEHRLVAGQPLLTTIPEIAARFVGDILEIQPAGPYFLAGQCEGGILAVEVALQLRGAGHEVALLAMLDTPVDGYFRLLPWARRIGNPTLMRAVALARAGNVQEILQRAKEHMLLRRLAKYMRDRRARRPATPEEQRSGRIWTAIWDAVRSYRQGPILVEEVEFFRAEEQDGIYEDSALGWDRRAKRVRVHDVPGDHAEYLTHPLARHRLTETIEEALSRAGHGRSRDER